MSEFPIKPATRQGIVPLIDIYSESGCGKTYSSLLLARGLAGPSGRIIMVDTESGRGRLYADVPIFGGYEVIDFEAPFTPERYCKVIEILQKEATVGIIDSGSHEWEGQEGVLDMAMANEQKSGRAGLHNWKNPKFEHAKFIQALMRSKIPLVVCLRAKYKTRQAKENGKTVIIKDDHTSPIQAEDFIFEATCHGEIMPDHSLRLTKWSHPGLKECFSQGPITIETGQKIGSWCKVGLEVKDATQALLPSDLIDKLESQESVELLAAVWKEIQPDYKTLTPENQLKVRVAKDKRKVFLTEGANV